MDVETVYFSQAEKAINVNSEKEMISKKKTFIRNGL